MIVLIRKRKEIILQSEIGNFAHFEKIFHFGSYHGSHGADSD